MNDNKRQKSVEEMCEEIDSLIHEVVKLEAENKYLVEELRKWKPRKVEQYTIDGEYVQTFESTSKAAKAMYGFPSCIRKALAGELKTAYGFKWKYVNDK